MLCVNAGKMWELWDEKISGDSETKNWMAINTKPCPKCTKPVEKNGGCNLVVCTCGQVSSGAKAGAQP
jgi:ariadne-1